MSSVASGVIPAQMLRAGAQAFITKRSGVGEMLKAIRLVHSGQRYVTPQVATQMGWIHSINVVIPYSTSSRDGRYRSHRC
jgi:two-component system invasion response regulator UvrY